MEKRNITDEKLQKVFQVTTCTDVDECSEGEHTCHPSATCRNTLGGSVSSFFVIMVMVICLFLFCDDGDGQTLPCLSPVFVVDLLNPKVFFMLGS